MANRQMLRLDDGRRRAFGLAKDHISARELYMLYRRSSSSSSSSSSLPSSFSFFTQTPEEFMKNGPSAIQNHAAQTCIAKTYWKNAFDKVNGDEDMAVEGLLDHENIKLVIWKKKYGANIVFTYYNRNY